MADTETDSPETPTRAARPPVGATPAPGQTVPVRVTDRGDGWPLPDRVLRAGETVEVDRPTARHLTDGGYAEWTTRIRATGPDVVTARAVLAKGQTAAVAPEEAERLVRMGVAEVVKEEG